MLEINIKDIPDKKYHIYLIEDKRGLKYIGLSSNIKARIRQYRYEYNTDKDIPRNGVSRAFKKYGVDGFKMSIIHSTDSLNEAMKLEEYYINKYDTTNPEKGYNLSNASTGVVKMKPRTQSKEEILNRSKKVYLIEMGVPLPFDSAKELAKVLKLSRNNVTRAARNGNMVRGRFVIYDDPDMIMESYNRVNEKLKSGHFKKPDDILAKETFLEYCLFLYNRCLEVIPRGSTE